MKDFTETIQQAYNIAFSKYDQELVSALDTAENILSNEYDKLTSAQLCDVYLTIAVCKTKMDVPDDILPLLFEAERLAIANENITTLITCLNLQANRLSRTGRLQEAIQKLLYVMEIVKTPESRVSILNNLGVVYTHFGLYDKALECLFEILRLCENNDDRKPYMRACVNIANCYFEMRNYEKSLEYFGVAKRISFGYPQNESTVSLTENLGLAYAYLSDFENAMEQMRQAQELEAKYTFVKNKGSLVYNIGLVNELKGNFEEALKYYSESLEIVRTTLNVQLLSSVINNKAGVHVKIGEYQIAEALLLESLGITTDNNLPTQKLDCLKQLAFLHQADQNYEKAFEYLNDFLTLNETVFNDKVKNGIVKHESDYLTEKIEQKAEIFRLQNVDLVNKNNTILEKQQQLEEVLAQLSDSNATKDKLFSILGHDLRGPVSSLQMTLELIVEGKCTPQEQKHLLKLLNEQTKNTYDLLENLLWWAQSQKEGLNLHPEILHINPLVETVRSIYLAIAKNKDVRIDVNLTDNLNVIADKDSLALILRNLVGNAIKYSPPNSAVTISGNPRGSKINIEVADQGIGINPDIFTAISQKNNIQSIPGTASEKGTGLGLSLCYEFAQKMNGKISLRKDYQGGTCIRLELPAK